MPFDYADLLSRYIAHVVAHEGTDYIGDGDADSQDLFDFPKQGYRFTADEWRELARLAQRAPEVTRRLGTATAETHPHHGA